MDDRKHIKRETELEREKKLPHKMIARIADSLLILDRYLRIKSANRSFYMLFQTEPEKIMIGRLPMCWEINMASSVPG